MLKTAQMTTLKTYIDSVPVLAALPNDSETALYIAGQLDIAAAPDFWVYRTVVTKQEVTSKPSVDGTTFSFPALISRTPQEQFGWSELWGPSGSCNPSLANVRQGFADVFSGTTNSAPAQRTHLQACSRRKATVAEKLLATGTGSSASPATLGVDEDGNFIEGRLHYSVIQAARSL